MAITLNGHFPNSSADDLSDNQLLEKISGGDNASFEVLFHRHYSKVYGLVFRLVGNRDEAEDVVQDVFIKLNQRPPTNREEHNVSAWLYRVATNTAYNAIRARKRLWERNQVLVLDKNDRPAGPEKEAESQDDAERVRLALARLAPQQGQLLLLRQLGLSYSELADLCEIKPSSVGKTLSRAADAFRKEFEAIERLTLKINRSKNGGGKTHHE
ncbi:MAG: RNA polymerase sigma-70 factor (ECF subfamily) [Cellvibrionaceae bacterium]|jgi:RNA polymerase sigma-70 factor (ECF subfamily)